MPITVRGIITTALLSLTSITISKIKTVMHNESTLKQCDGKTIFSTTFFFLACGRYSSGVSKQVIFI